MMNYDINHIYKFFKNGFDSFFLEKVDLNKNNGNKRRVQDKQTGMISLHSFPVDKSIESYYPEFKAIMLRRFDNIVNIIKNSSDILFLGNRKYNYKNISNFILSMEEIFTKPKFIYANISDENDTVFNDIFVSDRSRIFDIRFNDKHPNGDTADNPNFWMGNVEKWDEFLSCVKLNSVYKCNNI